MGEGGEVVLGGTGGAPGGDSGVVAAAVALQRMEHLTCPVCNAKFDSQHGLIQVSQSCDDLAVSQSATRRPLHDLIYAEHVLLHKAMGNASLL